MIKHGVAIRRRRDENDDDDNDDDDDGKIAVTGRDDDYDYDVLLFRRKSISDCRLGGFGQRAKGAAKKRAHPAMMRMWPNSL